MIVQGKNNVNAAFLQGAKQQVAKSTIGQPTAPNATPFSALQFGAVTSSAASPNTTAASAIQQAQKATNNLLPLNRAVSPSTAVAAQLAAQQAATNTAANGATPSVPAPTAIPKSADLQASKPPSAVDEFMNYVHETPAQKMQDAILASMGLTQKDLDAMTPDQRAAVQAKIAQKLKEKMQENAEKAGASANNSSASVFGSAAS